MAKEKQFFVGQRVRVKRGMHTGHEGEVTKASRDSSVVHVKLGLITFAYNPSELERVTPGVPNVG